MADNLSISPKPEEKTILNWQELRQQGIKRLEKLGTQIWTDFNLHDPGITILEVLSYAITDLGYRTNFPIEDLLASRDEQTTGGSTGRTDFFQSSDILSCNPVTANDIRRILIDTTIDWENDPEFRRELQDKCTQIEQEKTIRVIKNAWVELQEVGDAPLYLRLTYKISEAVVKRAEALVKNNLLRNVVYRRSVFEGLVGKASKEVFLQNVSAVQSRVADYLGTFQGPILNVYILDEEDHSGIFSFREFLETVINPGIEELSGYLLATQELDQLEQLALQDIALSFEPPVPDAAAIEALKEKDTAEGENIPSAFCPQSLSGLYSIHIELADEIDPLDSVLVNRIKKAVSARLHQHRNLGEDIYQVETIQAEKIGLCAEIAIREDADKEQVLAEIFYQIQEFLTPTVNIYTLQELKDDKGLSCEDIFNGPFLKNGFVLEEELDASPLRKLVHKSDLVKVIMDIDGVKTVRTLMMTKACEEKPGPEKFTAWCLEIPSKHKPVLDINCSEVKFKIGSIFTEPEMSEVKEKLSLLRQLRQKDLPENNLELEPPTGRYRNLDQYHSIQNQFPMAYHVGREGISDAVSDLRKAQVRQLKAYLLFYDQLLANYLAQLAEVRNLLSVSQDAGRPTYFYRALTEEEVPGIDELTPSPECNLGSGQTIGDKLAEIVEDEATRQSRRNQLLEHLIARFGEQFADYTLMMYAGKIGIGKNQNKSATYDEFLQEKAAFLQHIPEIGSERGKGFNYKAYDCGEPDIWNSSNVAGLKKRVCKLLGIHDFRRRTLSCNPEYEVATYPVVESGAIKCHRYQLRPKSSPRRILLQGVKEYVRKNNAKKTARDLYDLAMNKDRYFFRYNKVDYRSIAELESVPDNIVEIRVVIKNKKDNVLAQSEQLNKSEAQGRMEAVQNLAYPKDCGEEGFHLIEHILLRALQKEAFEILQPFRFAEGCVAADPYSFWITVLAPNWQDRFREYNTRYLFEQVLRREAPAHIGLRFLYLSSEEMYEFELPYKNWLEEKAKDKPNERVLMNNLNEVIRFLNRYKDSLPEVPEEGRTRLICKETVSTSRDGYAL